MRSQSRHRPPIRGGMATGGGSGLCRPPIDNPAPHGVGYGVGRENPADSMKGDHMSSIEQLLNDKAMADLHATHALMERVVAAMERGRALHLRRAAALRRDARRAATRRGHTLGRFSPLLPSTGLGGYADATCTACGAAVRIETAPAPNSIDVGGDAVAVGCAS